jgi:hypothetical protein
VIRRAIAACLALALGACATTPDVAAPARPDAKSYAVTPDAMADVDAALARAAASGKRVLVVFGANWCHDSTALAGWLATPRFAALLAERYELVFVNVGLPQTGDGHNLAVARRFGLAEMAGTPALLVLTPEGKPVNLDTAATWRNAASRSEEAIYAELKALAGLADDIAKEAGPGVNIHIKGDNAGCLFALSPEGPWYAKIDDLPGTKGGVRFDIRGSRETPWRCIAAGIYALQQAGAVVGFVSDPAN